MSRITCMLVFVLLQGCFASAPAGVDMGGVDEFVDEFPLPNVDQQGHLILDQHGSPESRKEESATTEEASKTESQFRKQLQDAITQAEIKSELEAPEHKQPHDQFIASSTLAPETPEMMEARITAQVKAEVQEQLLKEFEVMMTRNNEKMEAEIRDQLHNKESSSTEAKETPLVMQARIKAELQDQLGDRMRQASSTPAPETDEQMTARLKAELEAQMRDRVQQASSTPAPETDEQMTARLKAELEAQMRDRVQQASSTPAPETEEQMRARLKAELEAQMGVSLKA